MNLALLAGFIKESGMRKVGAGLLIFETCAFLRLREAMPANDFATVTMVVVGAIVAGNAFEHHVKGKKEAADAPATPAA